MDHKEPRTEDQLLEELAGRLQRSRLARGWSQAELAQQAGVSKRTVERLEQGASVQLGNWLRVLQALGLLRTLEEMLPAGEPGPMEQLRHKDRERQRAPRQAEESADEPWQWGEEA
ncbi:MAG: helix-turn-helix domain-containing protein [Planctomycetota bacterium]